MIGNILRKTRLSSAHRKTISTTKVLAMRWRDGWVDSALHLIGSPSRLPANRDNWAALNAGGGALVRYGR